jgi:HlyD family secretion protein
MFVKYILPAIAAMGVAFAVFSVVKAREPAPVAKPIMDPPMRPKVFEHEIAGAGLIEARRENVPIGTNVAGVVVKVHVMVGDHVNAGDPLFTLDDRPLLAELKVREAALASAEAELHKLVAAPRPEDVPPAEAAVEEAQAKYYDTEIIMSRTKSLYERGAGPKSEYDTAKYAFMNAKAVLSRTTAELDRLKKGTWKEDILMARARVEMAKSQVLSTKIDLDRLTTCALVDGEVLQRNVREGQFAAAVWKEPLIVLGDVRTLHVRVDIDEHDLPMFKKHAPAIAYLRGYPDPDKKFPLKFVRIEPYVIPKKSLTGDNSERVDTRVLQVLYALPAEDERPIPVYVGQQMDVYLEAYPPSKSASAEPATPPAPPAGSVKDTTG